MLDRFEVFRDAEKLVQSWGPIEYLFPQTKGDRFKLGDRVGVIVSGGETKDAATDLRYGWMTLGFKTTPEVRKGLPYIYEDDLLTGGRFQTFFKSRRCLIPVDRWFYHKQNALGKNWFCFHPIEKTPMAFAGLFNSFGFPDGTKINTVAIIGITNVLQRLSYM